MLVCPSYRKAVQDGEAVTIAQAGGSRGQSTHSPGKREQGSADPQVR